jgi:hypothetical protein
MITRRFVLSGLITAPAVIAADKLMPVHSLPQRYATVWGVGHDLEVVEHVIWEPTSIMAFGMSDSMDRFREVTAWEYGFPVKPMPKPINWRIDPTPDPMAWFDRSIDISRGITNITTYGQLDAWRESLRPELDGRHSVEWIQEQIKAERKILGS